MNKLLRFLHLGAIVAPLPVTLVNGTIADATDVMTDLNWIKDQVNANATAGAGMVTRNILINGSMEVTQRIGNAVTLAIAGGTKAYVLDRWQVSAGAGSAVHAWQVTGLVGLQFQYAMRVSRDFNNAATTSILLAQSLETYDSYQMRGQTVTLSFWAKAAATYSPTGAALTATVYTGTGTDENVLIGYTGSAASITSTVTLQLNNWARFTVTGTIPATATEVGVVFTMNPTGTAGATDLYDITGVQLEISPSASNYDFRPFVETYQRCLRYYQKSFVYETLPAQNAGTANYFNWPATIAGATSQTGPLILLPAPMRIAPTITAFNPSAANAMARNITQSADFSVTTLNATTNGISVTGTPPVATVVGDLLAVHYTLDAEL